MDFKNQKKQVLQGIDQSRKGNIDESIVCLVQFINSLDDYVTTSSCSGRSILYCSAYDEEGKKIKKDCTWLFTCHRHFDADELLPKVDAGLGDLEFKFEPFILHVQCSSIESARYLHTIAIGCGFRESGITVGRNGKVTLAIRCNIRLEVPLSEDGVLLVSDMPSEIFEVRTDFKNMEITLNGEYFKPNGNLVV